MQGSLFDASCWAAVELSRASQTPGTALQPPGTVSAQTHPRQRAQSVPAVETSALARIPPIFWVRMTSEIALAPTAG